MSERHRIHAYEKAFLVLSSIMLLVFIGALVYATTARGMMLPGEGGRIDPKQIFKTKPFDSTGVHQTGPNSYTVVIVAMAWAYLPSEIHIPAGAQITFEVSSADVIHGFEIPGTRVNMMVIPGQIGKLTHTFTTRGTYHLICHEYCGVGHQTMNAKVVVE
jgi:cytochrome c oxidase subunit II